MAHIEHLVLVVRSLDQALTLYQRGLGLATLEAPADVPSVGARRVYLRTGNCLLELLEPHDPKKPPGIFLATRGEGVFAIGLRVESLEDTVGALRSAGVAPAGPTGNPGDPDETWYVRPGDAHGVLLELATVGAPTTV
jgi:catechol 2,3-dioxygenase-like lactoylglutathione lyase family enzyme